MFLFSLSTTSLAHDFAVSRIYLEKRPIKRKYFKSDERYLIPDSQTEYEKKILIYITKQLTISEESIAIFLY